MNDPEDLRILTLLGARFDELSGVLLASRSGPPRPDRIVHFAARAVPHASGCSITLVPDGRRPRTIASTGTTPLRGDALQYETGEGPCLAAAVGRRDVERVDDLAGEPRWPVFVRRCQDETPARSIVSARLALGSGDRAAMNLYADEPQAFDDLDVGVATVFAPFAALAVQSSLHEEKAAQLETALRSSRQIGTAIGILMARQRLTADQAFAALARTSQRLNRKLRDVAADVEHTGELPA